ncbi:MAG: site-2 protease family protein [Chloroflexi bacterium]|nr:site-2 protease family protein [Chloroflexota bacterium]
MPSSIGVGRILGIRVDIHFSLFLIVAFLTWSLATGFLPDRYPYWSTSTYWLTGFVCALSLFVSVLLHELAHSLVAIRRGYRVEGITLFLLGGVSSIASESRRATDDFVISVVGPLSSLAIAAVIGVVVVASGGSSPVYAAVEYVAIINLLLGLFNLLPAFPLDGGRVLRAAIWAVTGSFRRASAISTRSGQVVGLLLVGFGVYQVIQGNALQGIWVVLVGWFLNRAASASRGQDEVAHALEGVTVGDVMDVAPPTVEPNVTIHQAVFDHLVLGSVRALIVCEGERVLGILSITDVQKVPQALWGARSVRDAMTPAPLKSLSPDDGLDDALSLLGENAIHQAPVLMGERLVGLLNRAHVIQYFHQMREQDRD